MIEVKNLSVGYGGRAVLSGVELTFRPGEVTALCGPNGCGKTTLLRTVLGLQPPMGGEVWVEGEALSALSPRERARKLAYLAQFRSVPNITAKKMVLHGRFPHLSYPRRYRAEDYAAVEEAMERAGAAELGDSLLPRLSGGERQRVYLAMALAQDTPCVLFDEPTTYLDPGRQMEVMEMARALARAGKTVVVVLHDLPLALRGSDQIVVLHGGGVRYAGTPEGACGSGILDRVFGVSLRRVETPEGARYYYA